MSGFKNGPVPNPSFENTDVNHFSQPTEFANDVYVYGKLYADIDASDVFTDETIEFNGLTVKKNFFVSGVSTFIGPVDMDFLTVFHRLNVGAAGTVFVAISSQRGADDGQIAGRVGIGTTQPDGTFQVGNECFIVKEDPCLVGIANSDPSQLLHINSGSNAVVVSSAGTFGVGTDDPGSFGTIDNAGEGYLRADFDGSIRIARNIYDSAGSPGGNGFFLQRDAVGVRWVSFEPSFTEGVFVQDEGVYIPTTGIAQSFTVFNFRQINSNGTGVDSLIPIPNPSNPTQIVDIQTQDFWGFNGNNIYRMSNVGIQNNNPTSTLDISGTLHATGDVDFDSALNVDGNTDLGGTLSVAGNSEFDGTVDVDADFAVRDGTTDKFFVDNVTGNTDIQGTLDVAGDTKIDGQTESINKDTGALIVDGGVGIEKRLNVGGQTIINDATTSTNKDSGALIVDGGVGIEENINIGGNGVIAGRLDVDSVQDSSSTATGALVVDGGVGLAKNLNVGQDTKLFGTLELESRIIDFFNNNGVGACKTDYRLSSFDVSGVGAGVSWRPSGVQTKRTLWVTKNGCDTNSGLLEGDAKYTIGAAAAIAQQGDTIRVRSGTYLENNPIGLRDDVAINGEDLRLVLLIPENKNRDFFHVRRGCLIENLSFTGANISDDHSNCGAVAFPPTAADVAAGFAFQAATGFTDLGPANEGSAGRWRSPYVRNCTNFMSKSIGMKINGDHANAAFTGTNDLGQDLKSMVCDSFTQYNEAGIGVSLSNNAYAQLVSIFTICSDIGIAATSGGQCDLTNSNSSFGRIGLLADGFGDVEFDGTTLTSTIGGADRIISTTTQDMSNNNRTPFDGQGAYFHLDMTEYADSPSTVTVNKPLELVRGIRVINGGNDGDYNPAAPPIVTLSEPPNGPESILPEFSPNVSAAGTITSIDVINSGRNFLPNQTLTVNVSGSGGAQLEVDMDPILFTVSEATETSAVVGLSTVIFNEFIPYPISSGVTVEFVRLSRVITSSHSFEYIGAGTDINTANPFQAGQPIPENEVVAINGGQVPFTSTDQKGNFRIGDGLTIDQTTSSIRGRDFNRAIQAQLTPLILALN